MRAVLTVAFVVLIAVLGACALVAIDDDLPLPAGVSCTTDSECGCVDDCLE